MSTEDAEAVNRNVNRATAAILEFLEAALPGEPVFSQARRVVMDQHELLRRRLLDEDAPGQHVRGKSNRSKKQGTGS